MGRTMKRTSGTKLPKRMSRRRFLQLSSVSSLATSSGASVFGWANARPAPRIEQEAGRAPNKNMQTAIREFLNRQGSETIPQSPDEEQRLKQKGGISDKL